MTRWLLALALVLCAPVASAAGIVFTDLCPGAARLQRSTTDPQRLEVYCVGEATPRLTLHNCPAPAKVTTRGNDRTIECYGGGGWPITVRQK